jgi:hypothetical protein
MWKTPTASGQVVMNVENVTNECENEENWSGFLLTAITCNLQPAT